MPVEIICHEGRAYPLLQTYGFAAEYAFPFAFKIINPAQENCVGFDIGCNRKEWSLPYSMPIDPMVDNRWDAYHLPELTVDYIFSSHCLEHLPNWVKALDYWATKIRRGGVLFLYLPHHSQSYWRPWHNRKHIHILRAKDIRKYFHDSGLWRNYFVTKGCDLNSSFYAVAEKI